jgi:hypothetical protein
MSIFRNGTYYFILCTLIIFSLFSLTFLGYLASPLQIVSSWLGALALVGAVCIFELIKDEYRLKKDIPLYQSIHSKLELMKKVNNPSIQPSCLDEIKIIRSNDKKAKGVICSPSFRKTISAWDNPDSIATFQALDSIKALFNEYFKGSNNFTSAINRIFIDNEDIIKSINNRFNKTEGCWYANRESRYPTIVAAYSIIGTAKDYLENKGIKVTRDKLADILGNDKLDRFEDFLLDRLDRDTGGFKDVNDKRSSVSTTDLVVRIVSMLYNEGKQDINGSLIKKMNTKFTFKEEARPWNFIMNCWGTQVYKGKLIGGFRERLDLKEPWVCVSYFSAVSLGILGKINLVKNEKYNKLFTSLLDSCCHPYLDENLLKDDSPAIGFSGHPKYKEGDLMHTNYALKLADIVSPEYLKSKDKKFFSGILNFRDQCKSGDGYAFKPNWQPNVMASCYARTISKIINRFTEKEDNLIDPISLIKLYISCYNRHEFSFFGYPINEKQREAA